MTQTTASQAEHDLMRAVSDEELELHWRQMRATWSYRTGAYAHAGQLAAIEPPIGTKEAPR